MKHTRPTLSILGSALLLSTTACVYAANDPAVSISEKERLKHETAGVVGGAVIGGVLGGPVGAVLSAGFGAWVSDLTVSKKENALLAAALDGERRELLATQAEYRALQARHELALRETESSRLRNASVSQGLLSAKPDTVECCQDTELSLHFKTGSTTIESLYQGKLAEFAALLQKMPDAVIEITGHADRRGETAANLALSQRRIQAVEERLRTLGVKNRALQTSAFGESRPATDADTLENNFFDRRVIVKVLSPSNGLLTRSED